MSSLPPSITISGADVQAWRDECVSIESQIKRLEAKAAGLKRKIEAAEVFFPGSVTAVEVDDADSVKTWVDLVLFALGKADGGRTQRYIMEVGYQTPLADRLKRAPNGMYNAVTRLLDRKEVVRHNDLFYLSELWSAIESGQVADNPEPTNRPTQTTAEAIIDVLMDGVPRAPKTIFADLKNADVAQKLQRSPQYGYTILGRLMNHKQLVKRDGFYTLPELDKGEDSALPSNVTLFTGLRAQDAK